MSNIRLLMSRFCMAGYNATRFVAWLALGLVVTCAARCITVSDHRKPNEQRNASDHAGSSGSKHACGALPSTMARETPLSPQLDFATTSGWVQNWTPWDIRIPRSGVFGRDCQSSQECEEKGWCAGPESPDCYLATEKSCRESFYCEYEGLCVVSGKICTVANENDCAKSTVCALSGQCSLGDGRCVATSDARCRRSSNCQEYGLCVKQDEICVAGHSADCRDAKICREFGQCHAVNDGCYALNPGDCEAPCKVNGRCHLERGICVARSDADCSGSTECAIEGRCNLFEGQCKTKITIRYILWNREDHCRQFK